MNSKKNKNALRKEFWELAKFQYPTHQIMLRGKALQALTFRDSYVVEGY